MDKITIKKIGKPVKEVKLPKQEKIVNPIEYVPDPIFNIETGERKGIDTVYSLYTYNNLMNREYSFAEPKDNGDIYFRRNAILNNFKLRVDFVMNNIYATISNIFRDYMMSIMKPGSDERRHYFGNFFMTSSHDFLYDMSVAATLTTNNIEDIATTMTFELYNSMSLTLNRYINTGDITVSFEEANKEILGICVEARTQLYMSIYLLSNEAELYRLNGYPKADPEICSGKTAIVDITKPYTSHRGYDDEF